MKWSLRRGSYSALNVYIIPAFGPHSRTLGRAIYPVSNPTVEQRNFDGILIHIGSMPGGDFQNYNEGKTLVHEAGHWLSLFHLWHSDFDIPGKEGGTCIPNGGDQVDDTPQQKDATLMDGCPGDDHDTCPNLPGKDMWWNFMDYTEDRCLTSFTFGQIKKMHGSWEALRKGK